MIVAFNFLMLFLTFTASHLAKHINKGSVLGIYGVLRDQCTKLWQVIPNIKIKKKIFIKHISGICLFTFLSFF